MVRVSQENKTKAHASDHHYDGDDSFALTGAVSHFRRADIQQLGYTYLNGFRLMFSWASMMSAKLTSPFVRLERESGMEWKKV